MATKLHSVKYLVDKFVKTREFIATSQVIESVANKDIFRFFSLIKVESMMVFTLSMHFIWSLLLIDPGISVKKSVFMMNY